MLTTSLTFPSQSPLFFPKRTPLRATVSEITHSETTKIKKSLYEVLRVKRNASQTEIKTAYKTLAKLYHPDATSRFIKSSEIAKEEDEVEDEDQEFIKIHNAYATLSDPDARAIYDANLNFNSRKSWMNGGFRRSEGGRFYSRRRWETDQCW